MNTSFADFSDNVVALRNRFSTRSLRDDEIRVIADSTYRGDNPLRFDAVRQAALMFERTGYVICRTGQVSPLAIAPQPVMVAGLVRGDNYPDRPATTILAAPERVAV
jgi:hypothetical protein